MLSGGRIERFRKKLWSAGTLRKSSTTAKFVPGTSATGIGNMGELRLCIVTSNLSTRSLPTSLIP